MAINDQIRDEKIQYDIDRKTTEISALSSGKIDKYEYLTGKEVLPSNQQQIMEQVKFTYSPLGKAFETQTKTIEDQGQKQVEALKTLKSDNEKLTIEDVIPENLLNSSQRDEAKKELHKIKKNRKNCGQRKLLYRASEYTRAILIKTFGRKIYNSKITLKEADEDQSNLLSENRNFKEKTRPQSAEKNQEKEAVVNNWYNVFEAREIVLDTFDSKIYLMKSEGAGF